MTPHPERIGPHDSIQVAAERMRGVNIGFLVVYDAPAGVVGVVTDRDITVRATAAGRDPTTEVREVMTTQALGCYDDDSVERAAALMVRHAVRRLVVLDRAQELVGVLSVDDVAHALGSAPVAGDVLRLTSTPL